ncbi:MAG: hypothetical protein J5379_00580 [Clostridiales bacterium]|nr:hypothetical protein [Clostridiales bacterium]
MELPFELRTAIEEMLEGQKPEQLKKVSAEITRRYKNESGRDGHMISSDLEAKVYAAVRMPATYGAVRSALSYVFECICSDCWVNSAKYDELDLRCEPEDVSASPVMGKTIPIRSVFDIGAGSGAATWAVYDALDSFDQSSPVQITCFEREAAMRKIGEDLMKADPGLSASAQWKKFDLLTDSLPAKADLVVSSYVLNELTSSARGAAIAKLWEATEGILLIVEPGTKEGFAVISEIREKLLAAGASLVAPCPHDGPCPIAPGSSEVNRAASAKKAEVTRATSAVADDPKNEETDDWCHFACRVARTRLHKQLKDADVPYEDEKYSYIAFARIPQDSPLTISRASSRVLRHPYITKGQIDLTLCTPNGIEKTTVRKRDGDTFKRAKKCKQGDSFTY